MDDQAVLIELTAHEIVFLTDNIQVGDVNVGDPEDQFAPRPIARNLLLKLGSVFVQVMTPTGVLEDETRALMLTEKEYWLIKARVRVGDLGLGGKPVGATILLKVVENLLKFNPDKPGVLLVSLAGVPSADESDDDSYPTALQRTKTRESEEIRDARAEDYPDYTASYNPRPRKRKKDSTRPYLPRPERQDHPNY